MSDELEDLPPGWMSTTIGDVTEAKVDQYGPSGKGEFTYVDISSVDNSTKVISDAKQVPISDAPSRARQQIRSGDVLVSMTRPNLNAVAKVPHELEGAIASTGFDILRTRGVEPNWLFAHVRSKAFIDSMSELVRGALYPAVNSKQVRDYRIPLPPLPEQRRIVAKIEALQARSRKVREALEAIPPLLEQFRQSVLAAAFRGDLTADWREKHPDVEPASVLLERIRAERRRKWEQAELAKFKAKGKVPKNDSWKEKYVEPEPIDDDDLPELPEGWCWGRIGDIATFFNGDRGKNYPNKNEYVLAGLPFINTGHIQPDGSLSLSDMNYITREKFDSLNGGKIEAGDLVYCLRGATLGKTAFVEQFSEGAIASSLVIIRPDEKRFTKYLYYFLVGPLGRAEIDKYDNGTAQPNLAANSVAEYLVPIPPAKEQDELIRIMQIAFKRVSVAKTNTDNGLTTVGDLDQSILAKAFRGELVPQDPNDEPASVLLERIQAERAAESSTTPSRRSSKLKRQRGKNAK